MDRGSAALSADLDLLPCGRRWRPQTRSCLLRCSVQRAPDEAASRSWRAPEPTDLRFRLDRVSLRYRLRAGFRRRSDGDDPLQELLVLPGHADLRLPDDGVRAQTGDR